MLESLLWQKGQALGEGGKFLSFTDRLEGVIEIGREEGESDRFMMMGEQDLIGKEF